MPSACGYVSRQKDPTGIIKGTDQFTWGWGKFSRLANLVSPLKAEFSPLVAEGDNRELRGSWRLDTREDLHCKTEMPQCKNLNIVSGQHPVSKQGQWSCNPKNPYLPTPYMSLEADPDTRPTQWTPCLRSCEPLRRDFGPPELRK